MPEGEPPVKRFRWSHWKSGQRLRCIDAQPVGEGKWLEAGEVYTLRGWEKGVEHGRLFSLREFDSNHRFAPCRFVATDEPLRLRAPVAVLLALVLAGCATVQAQPTDGACLTRCGMLSRWNCAELQETEDAVVKAFDRYVDNWSADQVCTALAGWVLVQHHRTPADKACGTAWVLFPVSETRFVPGCATGYTHTHLRMVEVVDTNWRTNALAHELVHVVDFTRYGLVGHCRWKERGVKKALRAVNGYEDTSPSKCADSE